MKLLLLLALCFALEPMDKDNENLTQQGVRFDIIKTQNGDFVGVLFENERTTTVKRYHHTGQFKYHCVAIMHSGEIRQVPVKKDDLHFLMLKIKGMHQKEIMNADLER